jgi:hypothetical protein
MTDNKYFEYFIKIRNANEPFELEAIRLISSLNNSQLKERCDTFEYDFIMSDNIKYEVKADHASTIYNNYFIECNNDKGLSGISTTKADKYIITDGAENYYMIDVKELKKIIRAIKPPIKLVNKDMLNTKGFIISCTELNKCMQKIK